VSTRDDGIKGSFRGSPNDDEINLLRHKVFHISDLFIGFVHGIRKEKIFNLVFVLLNHVFYGLDTDDCPSVRQRGIAIGHGVRWGLLVFGSFHHLLRMWIPEC